MLKVAPLGAETRETSICLALVVAQIMSTVKKNKLMTEIVVTRD
jgi:hypothetical protein